MTTAREAIALAIQNHDNDQIPDGYANDCANEDVSDWSVWLSDSILSALDKAGYPVEAMREALEKIANHHEGRGCNWDAEIARNAFHAHAKEEGKG